MVCLFVVKWFFSRHVTTQEYWFPKRAGSIQYGIENGTLMQECFPKHLRMGSARLKSDNETKEESKKRRINIGRSTADTKKEVLSRHFVVSSLVSHSRQSVS